MTYSETCAAAFRQGPKSLRKLAGFMETFADWALFATGIGASCVYVVLVAESFHEVVGLYVGDDNPDLSLYCVILLVPLLSLGQIRNLKYLVPFSALANGMLLLTLGIIMFFIFQDMPPTDDKPLFTSIGQVPMFVNTVIFALMGIGVVMPVENQMRNPHRFLGCPGVLNIAMGIVIVLYTIIGLFGYLRYGDNVLSSITRTLCNELIPAQVAKIMVGLATLFSYGLVFFVPMDILFRKVEAAAARKYHNWLHLIVRTFFVCLSVVVAIVVPQLDLLISFVGAVFFSTLGLLIPAAIEIVYCWDGQLGFLMWRLWKDILIVAFSLIALVSGAYLSIYEMVNGSQAQTNSSTCGERPFYERAYHYH